jgi:hypothetical protein
MYSPTGGTFLSATMAVKAVICPPQEPTAVSSLEDTAVGHTLSSIGCENTVIAMFVGGNYIIKHSTLTAKNPPQYFERSNNLYGQ